MEINTTRFGEITVENHKKIFFKDGLLGFESLKNYVLIPSDDNIFFWLQSIDDSDVALACMDPLNVCENYDPVIESETLDELKIENNEQGLLICVVVIPDDITKSTINLAAPILINHMTQEGKQIILQDNRYPIRHDVFSEGGE